MSFEEKPVVWDDQKVTNLWDYYARNPSYQNQYFSRQMGKIILQTIKPWVDFRQGKILDFGCGPGYLIEHLLPVAGGPVYGLDFSAKSVDAANQKFQGRKNFGGAVCVQGLPSSFAAGEMDFIIAVEVIEHLSDEHLNSTFQEIYRLLRPGGIVVLTTPNEEDLDASKTACPDCGCVFHRWQHVRNWSASSLRPWLDRHNLRPIVIQATRFQAQTNLLWLKETTKRVLGMNRSLPHLLAVATRSR